MEAQFDGEMTWDNYGKHWVVDHMTPCKSFDHTNYADVLKCWHYTNLQPLERHANQVKAARTGLF